MAKKRRSPGGSAAVQALVALKAPRESQLYEYILCRLTVIAEKFPTTPTFLTS